MCPVFDFQHETTGEIISVLVKHTEPDHLRHEQTVDGKIYKRVYSAPTTAKDTKTGDCTLNDFSRVTEGKNLTVGQMWKISEEMSKARADKNGGLDPVKEKFYKDFEKKNGKKHEDVIRRERVEASKNALKQFGIAMA